MIEYVAGDIVNKPLWGKFHVNGLERYVVFDDDGDGNKLRNKRMGYQYHKVINAPTNTVFTITEQSGNKYGNKEYTFLLCAVDDNLHYRYTATYGEGLVTGGFYEIGRADTLLKVPRLIEWWGKRPGNVDPLAYAYHCAKYINSYGVAVLPPMETH